VLNNGPTLGKGHQTWQMNEINALTWPAPNGIGVMDKAAFDRTAKIAQDFKVIKKAPSPDAYRHRPRAGRGRRDLGRGRRRERQRLQEGDREGHAQGLLRAAGNQITRPPFPGGLVFFYARDQ
jgi:hypothetical protein